MKKIELPVEEIVKEWQAGATYDALAQKHGVSVTTISDRIRRETGMTHPKRTIKKPYKIELPVEKIVKEWQAGATYDDLAKAYGVSVTTISDRIRRETGMTHPKRTIKIPYKSKIQLPIEEIIKKWLQGESQKDLAAEYRVDPAIICKEIKKYYEKRGLEKPKPKRYRKKKNYKKELPMLEIIKEYENGATYKALSEKYNASISTISKRIKQWYQENGKEMPVKKKKPQTELSKEEPPKKTDENKKTRILRSSTVILEHLKKGATLEQIKQIAEMNNVTIPDEIMEQAIKMYEEYSRKKQADAR